MCTTEKFLFWLMKKDKDVMYVDDSQKNRYISEGWKKIKEQYLGGKKHV